MCSNASGNLSELTKQNFFETLEQLNNINTLKNLLATLDENKLQQFRFNLTTLVQQISILQKLSDQKPPVESPPSSSKSLKYGYQRYKSLN